MKNVKFISIGCFALFLAFASCEKEAAPDPPINPEKPDSYFPESNLEGQETSDATIAEVNTKRYILEMESSLPNE